MKKLLHTAPAAELEAEQLQDGGHGDRGADGGEVDGGCEAGAAGAWLPVAWRCCLRRSRAAASLRSRAAKISCRGRRACPWA